MKLATDTIENSLNDFLTAFKLGDECLILSADSRSNRDAFELSKQVVSRLHPGARFSQRYKQCTLAGGEKITFAFCKNSDQYANKLHGLAFDYIGYSANSPVSSEVAKLVVTRLKPR